MTFKNKNNGATSPILMKREKESLADAIIRLADEGWDLTAENCEESGKTIKKKQEDGLGKRNPLEFLKKEDTENKE